MKQRGASIRIQFWLIVCIHLGAALILKHCLGIDIEIDPSRPWNYFWQTISSDLLKSRFFESIWNLHSQPPFHNICGGIALLAFGKYQLQALQYFYILLGSLSSGMIYALLQRCIRNDTLAFIIGLLLAFNPSLFLFEAYILYTIPSTFFIIATLYYVSRYSKLLHEKELYFAIIMLNLLLITRSAYHIFILPAAIAYMGLLCRKRWKRIVLVSLLISTISLTWYGKNLVKFGFFGSSSWTGYNFWNMVRQFQGEGFDQLVENGVIHEMVAKVPPFSSPSTYRKYGFTKKSAIAVLSSEDLHNVNVPDISRVYGKDAIKFVIHYPVHYIQNVFRAYYLFCRPSWEYGHLHLNAQKLKLPLKSHLIRVRSLTYLIKDLGLGSIYFVMIPFSLLMFCIYCILKYRWKLARWKTGMRNDATLFWAAFFIVYTTVVCCAAELGENARFKFMIEHVLWFFFISVLYKLIIIVRSRSVAHRKTM
jgi:hypothetical protein